MVDKQMKKYLKKVELAKERDADDENISYMKLPYIGYSILEQYKMKFNIYVQNSVRTQT